MTPDWLYRALGLLESNPVINTMTKEVIGINLPKIATTRSDTERMDVAVSEVGNTLAFGVGGGLANVLFRRIFQVAQRTGATPTQMRWAELGRSMGIYSVIFSSMWAMPFIRNYITARQTGSVHFTEVIETHRRDPRGKPHTHQAMLRENMAYYRDRALGILGLGLGSAAGIVGVTKWASLGQDTGKRCIDALFRGLHTLEKSRLGFDLIMKKGEFAKFGTWPALLFWGLPAYGGWIHASRDPYEKKEQLLKFANFVLCFFGPPALINKLFAGKFPHNALGKPLTDISFQGITTAFAAKPALRNQALRLWAGKNLLGLGVSILLLGAMPQLINIQLTKRRIQRDAALRQAAARYAKGRAYGAMPRVAALASGGQLPHTPVHAGAACMSTSGGYRWGSVPGGAAMTGSPAWRSSAMPVRISKPAPLPTYGAGAQFWRTTAF